MPIEVESPEQLGYDTIANNLSESSFGDRRLCRPRARRRRRRPAAPVRRPPRAARAARAIARRRRSTPTTCSSPPAPRAALFIVATSLLEPGDHAVVVRTNYATNLETPRAIGADVDFVDLRFEDGWRLDVERVAAALRPETRLVSVTCPHNPTGAMLGPPSSTARRARRARTGARGCSSTRPTASSPTARPLPMAATLSAARDQRLVDVEGLRAARPAHRLGRVPRPRARRRRCSRPRSRC